MVVAVRNRLIHGYLGVDDDTVWSIVRDDVAPLRRALIALLASSKEKPVWLSEVVHGYPRAGSIPPVTLADGLDTVDASELEATFLGHSDFATQRPLLQDLFSLLKASLEPRERLGLESVTADAGAAYWRIK
jgi:Protein of unknown function DUF86